MIQFQRKIQKGHAEIMQNCYYQRLRDIREDKEKTQKEIAELLNTTYQYYSAYERGVRDLPCHHLRTLAQFYNVSADYLLGLIDEPREIK